MPPMATDVAASSSGNIGTGGQWSIDGLGSGSTDDGRPQDSRKQLMEGATIGMCATMFAFFLMRAYCRFRLLKMARVEDWLIIPGVIFAILQAIYIVLNAEAGGGEHIWNIKKENLLYLVRLADWAPRSIAKQTSYLNNLFFVLSIAFIKFSMVFQIMAITIKGSKTRKFILVVFGISIAFSIANFLLALLPCVPISYMWNQLNPKTTEKGKCMDLQVVSYTTSACSIVMDLMIWIAPMPLLFKLKIRRPQKIALMGVFSLGGGACAAAIARCVSIYNLTHNEKAQQDAGYYKVELILWSVAETNIAIICASLPLLRPLLKAILPNVFSGSSRNRSKSGGPGAYASASIRTGQAHPINLVPMRKKPAVHDGYGSSTEELAEGLRHGTITTCTVAESVNEPARAMTRSEKSSWSNGESR